MANKQIKVLHLDTERSWRGGQQQAAYLFESMYNQGFTTKLICQPDSAFKQYCKDRKLPYTAVSMRSELDIIAAVKIAAIARREGYNILHLHSAHAISLGLLTKIFYLQLKLIGVRRVDFHIRKNLFSKIKYNHKYLDRIVCISKAIRQVLLKDNILPNKLITIHSGIDLHKFDNIDPNTNIREEFSIPENQILVGTVAAFAGHKDYPNLLRAARHVLDRSDNVTFCAVGTGKEEKMIKQLHSELNLGSRFIFAGFRKDVGTFLKSFDLLVLASKKEGLGTSILDAQSVGLPVVGTRTGGIPEAVHHQCNGLLVPARDPLSFAEAILQLISDSQKIEEYGRNAMQSVQNFSIENTVRKNIELYELLLSENTTQ